MPRDDDLNLALAKLITASHILHHKDVLDAYGHVSIRNPLNHNTFFSSSIPANLITGPEDLLMWNVSDGSPVKTPIGGTLTSHRVSPNSEHHIHASIFLAYPGVHSIIHAHTPLLIAFATPSCPPLRAVTHMSAFLGPSVPVFDVARRYSKTSTASAVTGFLGGFVPSAIGGSSADSGTAVVGKEHPRNLLINTKSLGDALAAAFVLPASAGASALEMARSLTIGGGSAADDKAAGGEKGKLPDHTFMLLRGHGAVTWGESIEDAVYRAVYALENAKVQEMGMRLQDFGRAVSKGKGSVSKDGKLEVELALVGAEAGFVGGLSEDEMRDAAATINGGMAKAWPSWCREVRKSGVYENVLDEHVGGKR